MHESACELESRRAFSRTRSGQVYFCPSESDDGRAHLADRIRTIGKWHNANKPLSEWDPQGFGLIVPVRRVISHMQRANPESVGAQAYLPDLTQLARSDSRKFRGH